MWFAIRLKIQFNAPKCMLVLFCGEEPIKELRFINGFKCTSNISVSSVIDFIGICCYYANVAPFYNHWISLYHLLNNSFVHSCGEHFKMTHFLKLVLTSLRWFELCDMSLVGYVTVCGEDRTQNAGLFTATVRLFTVQETITVNPRALPWLPCHVFFPKSPSVVLSAPVSLHSPCSLLSDPHSSLMA